MEFHQQHARKKQVKTLVTMEGRFEHDPSMTRDRPRFPSKMHVEHLQNEAILRDFLLKCNWKT